MSFADGLRIAQVGYWLISVWILAKPLGNNGSKENPGVESLHPDDR